MSRWAERARARTATPEALTKPTEGGKEGVLALLAVPTPGAFPSETRKRLRTLAAAADCPEVHVDNLHPAEVEAYDSYSDGEVVASLRHLAQCPTCLERQTRRVTCGTCASFVPNRFNPGAGMGGCSMRLGGDGAPAFPDAHRRCHAWEARR